MNRQHPSPLNVSVSAIVVPQWITYEDALLYFVHPPDVWVFISEFWTFIFNCTPLLSSSAQWLRDGALLECPIFSVAATITVMPH